MIRLSLLFGDQDNESHPALNSPILPIKRMHVIRLPTILQHKSTISISTSVIISTLNSIKPTLTSSRQSHPGGRSQFLTCAYYIQAITYPNHDPVYSNQSVVSIAEKKPVCTIYKPTGCNNFTITGY